MSTLARGCFRVHVSTAMTGRRYYHSRGHRRRSIDRSFRRRRPVRFARNALTEVTRVTSSSPLPPARAVSAKRTVRVFGKTPDGQTGKGTLPRASRCANGASRSRTVRGSYATRPLVGDGRPRSAAVGVTAHAGNAFERAGNVTSHVIQRHAAVSLERPEKHSDKCVGAKERGFFFLVSPLFPSRKWALPRIVYTIYTVFTGFAGFAVRRSKQVLPVNFVGNPAIASTRSSYTALADAGHYYGDCLRPSKTEETPAQRIGFFP